MARTLCVANQKGGVGKTTTAINLAVALATSSRLTLLVDLDPQCNATTGLGARPAPTHPLLSAELGRDSIRVTNVERLSLLPGSHRYGDVALLANCDAVQAADIRRRLTDLSRRYEFIVIDSPPSAGRLTQTALSAADEVLMPIQCEYFALEGLKQMIYVIRDVIRTQQSELGFSGILLTMCDDQLELTREVEAEVREFFGEIVFDTTIPRDVAVAEAPSHGVSVLQYAPRSRGARAYVELCMEVLSRERESES